MVKIRNVIRKKVYVPPRVETILVENESLMVISTYTPGQGAGTGGSGLGTESKESINQFSYTRFQEYLDTYEEDTDLDDILYRLR